MTVRPTLPQNYIFNAGNVIDAIGSISGWATSSSSISLDTVNFIVGVGSVKMTVTDTSGSMTKSLPIVLSDFKKMSLGVYFYTDPATTLTALNIYLTKQASGFSTYRLASIASNKFKIGWNTIQLSDTEFSVSGELLTDIIQQVRIGVTKPAGTTLTCSFNNFRGSIQTPPMCVITFDDGLLSQYSLAYPAMAARNIPGTVYVCPLAVEQVGLQMTLGNAQALYAAGWAVANHTYNHLDLTTLAESEIRSEISTMTDWLIEKSMPRAAYHAAYPGGNYNSLVESVMTSLGMQTGRSISAALQKTTTIRDNYLYCYSVLYTHSLATVQANIDLAVSRGDTIFLCFHHIVEAGPLTTGQWLYSDFVLLLEYILSKKINCVTIDQWYNGLTNPRYRSLPVTRAVT